MPFKDLEKRRACRRAYYRAHREQELKRKRIHYLANVPKYRAYTAKWKMNNPEALKRSRMKSRRKRKILLGIEASKISKKATGPKVHQSPQETAQRLLNKAAMLVKNARYGIQGLHVVHRG